ncbi:hypothetical protein AGMMS49942_01820 [Spirochaetia bacterium]|nr:hypothetical protein AGMMS49942_01820 [Spirochaetia bacterium]
MEKPGMGRGHRSHGPRLLILLPLIFLLGQSGEVPGGESTVLVESSPARPVLDGAWRISIQVDHPVPEEVTVIPPELPPSLTFAQSRKEKRGGRWTLAEFLYVPHRTGEVTLGSFEVLTPVFSIRTEELRAYVTTAGGAPEYHPRLVWEALPAALSIGETAELSLRIRDGEPGRSLRPGPFHATAPAEAILEELPLTDSDLDQGRVLRIRLTPLSGTLVTLGPFTLRFDTLRLESPAVSIRLRPPVSGNPAPANAAPISTVPEVSSPLIWAPPPFPENADEPFPLFRKAYEETLDRARELWSRACYAEALAELRRGERDLLSGPKLAIPRRAAEEALGLTQKAGTADEKWRPRNFFSALIVLSFCSLFLILRLSLGGRRRGSAVKKGGISLCILLLVTGILGLEKTAPETGYLRESAAVLRAGPGETLLPVAAYRVPDTQGAISARWMEGQPVRIRAAAGVWAYAESPDGEAGWVPQDNLVFY